MLFKKLIRILKANSIKPNEKEPLNIDDLFKEYEERSDKGYYNKTNNEEKQHNNENKYKPHSVSKEKKYYDVLELPENSAFEEIKKSYKKLMKKYHPDKFPNDDKKRDAAQNLAQQINEAYSYFEKKFFK